VRSGSAADPALARRDERGACTGGVIAVSGRAPGTGGVAASSAPPRYWGKAAGSHRGDHRCLEK
jgi:hypothetical protein